MRPVAALVVGAAVVLGARASDAKPPKAPMVATHVSPGKLEVDQIFHVTLSVQGDDARVSNPSLAAPPGVELLGAPGLTHKTFTRIEHGRVKSSTQVEVTWQFVARAVGRHTINPPSATVNGKRVTGNVTSVEVVPSTGAPGASPQNPLQFPQIPGMPPLKIPGWPFGDVEPDDEPPPSARPDLDMPAGPNPDVFIRGVVDKDKASTGEQVTADFYLYCSRLCQPDRIEHEPAFAEFRRKDVVVGKQPELRVHVGGKDFGARLIQRFAVAPLHAGDVSIGSLIGLVDLGRRTVTCESQDVVVHVTDPPLAGRPPGYSLGDVGQFSLTAVVQPRKVDLGGSVAVTLRVAGGGFPPPSLRVPAKKGVEWLDPEKKETIEVQGGKVVGTGTFGYVVKLANSGELDLGTVELPYWDPVAKKYAVASAALGNVEVSGVMPADPGEPALAPNDALLGALPPSRKELAPYVAPEPSRAFEGRRFWAMLAAPPLGVALFAAGGGALRAMRRRRALGAASPRAAAERALAQAAEAARDGAHVAAAAAVERACHAALEAAFGLRSRGVLLAELPAELGRAGASEPLATRVRELLAACDDVRFAPEHVAATAHSAQDVVDKGRALVPEILRAGKA